MEAQFSEFQFAYSITREIEDKVVFSNLGLGMPHLPNQREEYEGGYDVSFKGNIVAVFLQYKIPEKLTRSTANEWGTMSGKYFRFNLYPDSQSPQHNNLCRLAKKDRRNQVFYCAPAFIEYEKLTDYHKMRCVSQNSAFINCYQLPEIKGDDRHNICYKINPEAAVMNSETKYINVEYGWAGVYERMREFRYENVYEFLKNTAEKDEELIRNHEPQSAASVLDRIGRNYVEKGIHMLLLGVDER